MQHHHVQKQLDLAFDTLDACCSDQAALCNRSNNALLLWKLNYWALSGVCHSGMSIKAKGYGAWYLLIISSRARSLGVGLAWLESFKFLS
jgi:hypothetical protein